MKSLDGLTYDRMDLNPQESILGLTATKYSGVASLAALIYDHVINFDLEVNYVWTRQWSFGKALFVLSRYFGLFTLIPYVVVSFLGSLSDNLPGVCCTDQHSTVTIVTSGFCIASAIGFFLVFHFGLPKAVAFPPPLTGCSIMNVPKFYALAWGFPLISETVQCVFMLHKAWRLFKERRNLRLMNLIIRDSVISCLAAPDIYMEFALGWGFAIPCTMGARLLLNMRKTQLEPRENTARIRDHVPLRRSNFRLTRVDPTSTTPCIAVASPGLRDDETFKFIQNPPSLYPQSSPAT
ncbi:hypothetical protein K439DRAFT_1145005 [Ramaria rubella]|nr:hypothetical protein K439DRAFT_1145005 [Ramaria rubella]